MEADGATHRDLANLKSFLMTKVGLQLLLFFVVRGFENNPLTLELNPGSNRVVIQLL